VSKPSLPRQCLAHLPTPLEAAPRLGAALGLAGMWVKRDDCTGLALGGAKVRALEYYLADARAKRAGAVLTVGSAYSNHLRLTAAAAARCGLACIAVVTGSETESDDARLEYVRQLGAEIRFVPDASPWQVASKMRECLSERRARGEKAYTIPMGGGAPLGAVGYAESMAELAMQLEALSLRPPTIVVGVGSGGTLAGLRVGARRYLPGARLVGVSVGPRSEELRLAVQRIVDGTVALLGEPPLEARDVEIRDDWAGPGYGMSSPAVDEAVSIAARTEGLLVDPVYTGKVILGIKELRSEGTLRSEEPVIFWHTGFSSLHTASSPTDD